MELNASNRLKLTAAFDGNEKSELTQAKLSLSKARGHLVSVQHSTHDNKEPVRREIQRIDDIINNIDKLFLV